jgi:putative FmdB family regulatory protein
MPFYEFECTQCHERFEMFATLAQKEKGLEPACPSCGSTQARRIFDTLVLIPHGGDTPVPNSGSSCCGGG